MSTEKLFLDQFSKETLEEILNVSEVEVIEGRRAVLVSRASGTKCNRCWRYTNDTSNYGIWQNVCTRCQSALTEMGIHPPQPEAAQ
jgi:isoleucyl-tRNA synthetase